MLAVDMDSTVLERVRGLKDVLYVEEDGLMYAQQGATWGLDRVDQRSLPLDGVYNSAQDGTGVNVYIIDTGVSPDHVDFGGVGGRCEMSYDAVGGIGGGVDCNGHGTHCSGTTSGSTWGVAKNSMVYGVRVLSCLGSGSTSGAAALILQANPSMSPDDVWTQMAADATPDVVSDPGFRSPNTFLYVPSA